MLTETDPHFAVGVSQGRLGLEPYTWQNREHQRKYDAGYQHGVATRARLTETRMQEWTRYTDNQALYRQLQRLAGRTP